MVKESLHGYKNSCFYVDKTAKMLVARLDNWVIRNDVTKHVISSLENLFTFHFFENDITKMVRSSKIIMSAVMAMLLDIK